MLLSEATRTRSVNMFDWATASLWDFFIFIALEQFDDGCPIGESDDFLAAASARLACFFARRALSSGIASRKNMHELRAYPTFQQICLQRRALTFLM